MGKDNSSSKSELRLQLDKTNEILKKTKENFEEGFRKLKEIEMRNKTMLDILEEFKKQIVVIDKTGVLGCEHNFCRCICPYITDAEMKYYRELFSSKENAMEEIKQELTEKMKQYFSDILKDLSKLTGEEFYIENCNISIKVDSFNRISYTHTDFSFVVNIR